MGVIGGVRGPFGLLPPSMPATPHINPWPCVEPLKIKEEDS